MFLLPFGRQVAAAVDEMWNQPGLCGYMFTIVGHYGMPPPTVSFLALFRIIKIHWSSYSGPVTLLSGRLGVITRKQSLPKDEGNVRR